MIESNHDLEMLRNGPYPWMVKQRVMSRVGHLSNAALAEFFAKDYDGQAAFLVLAHLSEQNNHPEVARETAFRALGGKLNLFQSCALTLARQDHPLQPLCLG
jgi:phosphoribosyl 1,2-cyclic phosphodiesterase